MTQECYIFINEKAANVGDITEKVKETMDKNDLILVSNNGLPIQDIEGTTGKYDR